MLVSPFQQLSKSWDWIFSFTQEGQEDQDRGKISFQLPEIFTARIMICILVWLLSVSAWKLFIFISMAQSASFSLLIWSLETAQSPPAHLSRYRTHRAVALTCSATIMWPEDTKQDKSQDPVRSWDPALPGQYITCCLLLAILKSYILWYTILPLTDYTVWLSQTLCQSHSCHTVQAV